MAQTASLLTKAEKQQFGVDLLSRTEKLLSEAPTNDEERRIRKAICSALSQPSINRLRAYAAGKHFPTPKIVRALALALGDNPLALLRFAGYDREVILDLHDLRVANRNQGDSSSTRGVIEYAVRLFPRRGERYRRSDHYLHAVLELFLSFERADRRVPLAKPLARAYDVLSDNSLEAECRRALVGELVRSWAYGVDASFARSIESSAYVRVTGIGEPPGIPFLPVRPLMRAVNATRRQS